MGIPLKRLATLAAHESVGASADAWQISDATLRSARELDMQGLIHLAAGGEVIIDRG
jgi:hypothetical protein